MDYSELGLGVVIELRIEEGAYRVLAFDRYQVFYDRCSDGNGWVNTGTKRVLAYYRLPTDYVLAHAKVLRCEPLSDSELEQYRPELPFWPLRTNRINWDALSVTSSFGEFAVSPAAMASGLSAADVALPTPAVALQPFLRRSLAATPVRAGNGRDFSSLELLWHALKVQVPFGTQNPDPFNGIGIYRTGHTRTLPSYYLWGANDRAHNAPQL
jgi:hypothetical protein